MKFEYVKTADGSKTLFSPQFDEHYHSTHGALAESEHVFIQAGLAHLDLAETRIFEVGFGTGLNAILAYRWAKEHNNFVEFHSIEKYPLSQQIIENLDFSAFLSPEEYQIFTKMHNIPWNELYRIDNHFSLHKIEADLLHFHDDLQVDIIFMDAFAPTKQPEMWQNLVIEYFYKILKTNGILVTYAAQGELKRRLREVGFELKRLVGPVGKFHMLRAKKKYLI